MNFEYEVDEFCLRRAPDITLHITNKSAINMYRIAACTGNAITVNVMGWHGLAFVREVFVEKAIGGVMAKVILRPTGAPNSATPQHQWPEGMRLRELRDAARLAADSLMINVRCGVDFGEPIKKEKTVIKKFYVGKPEVVEGNDHSAWGKDTLPEAIEHAKGLARTTGRPQYVVKVIKVVARQEPPVSVKDVK